jgi:hypothetical protein
MLVMLFDLQMTDSVDERCGKFGLLDIACRGRDTRFAIFWKTVLLLDGVLVDS